MKFVAWPLPVRDAVAVALLGTTIALFFGSIWLFKGPYFVHDIVTVMAPLEELFGRIQRSGESPLWSPEIHGGYPLLAYGQLGYYYPPHMVLRHFLSGVWVINLSLAIHTFIASLGMYALVRASRLSPSAGLLVGLAYAFGGAVAARFAHVGMVLPLAWLPWSLFTLDRLLREFAPWRAWLILWVGVNVLQVMAGHPQSALMGLIVQLVWCGVVIGQRQAQRRVIGRIVLGSVVVVGFLLIHLLPTLNALPYTDRAGGLSESELFEFSAPPDAFLGLVVPHPFGRGVAYRGPKGESEVALYVGPVVVLFAAVGLYTSRQKMRQDTLVVSGLVLVVLGIILGLGEYSFIYRWFAVHTPQNFFSVPVRYFLLIHVGMLLLAARGVSFVPRQWRLMVAILGIVPVVVVAWMWEEALPNWSAAQPPGALAFVPSGARLWSQEKLVDPAPADNFGIAVGDPVDSRREFRQSLTSPGTSITGIRVRLARPLKLPNGQLHIGLTTPEGIALRQVDVPGEAIVDSEWTQVAFAPLAVDEEAALLVTLSSTWSGKDSPRLFFHTNPTGFDFNPTGALSVCQTGQCHEVEIDERRADASVQLLTAASDAISAQELLRPHIGAGYGVNSGQWTGALSLVDVAAYLAAVDGHRVLLDRLGITHVIGWSSPYQTLSEDAGWKEVAAVPVANGFIRIVENQHVWPRWHWAEVVRAVSKPEEQLAALLKINDRETVVAAVTNDSQYEAAGDIAVVYDGRTKLVLTTKRDTPGFLVVRDLYFPEWKVWIDGELEPIYRTDVLWRGLSVPAGQHTIVFRYRPSWVRPAAWGSSLALGVVLVLVWQQCLQRRKTIADRSLER